jgi:heterodisulfide reductase subunit C
MPIRLSLKALRGPLIRKVREISGQDANLCMQCGLCAGSCPMTGEMEIYTRRAMHLLQLGQIDAVLAQRMAYLCASCHACQARCPRGIDIPKLVEALRLLSLRSGENYIAPESIPAERRREMPQALLVAGLRKFTA